MRRSGVITRRILYFKFVILEWDNGLLNTILKLMITLVDVSSEAGRNIELVSYTITNNGLS